MGAVSKDHESTVTPRLRFPEFRRAEWHEVRLGELGKLVGGLTYAPKDVQRQGLLVMRSSNIRDGEISLDNCVFVRENIEGANRLEPNDILICVRNGSKTLIGKNALIPKGMPPCTHGAFMTVFRTKSSQFVFQLFQTKAYQKQVAGDLGATINSINGGQLRRYRFVIPDDPEQQKIAGCLASMDEVISAQRRKVATLIAHKRGLMQQLFPREGETVPRLRFPGFERSGGWVRRRMGDLLDRASKSVRVDAEVLYREIGVRSHGKGIFHKEAASGKAIGNKRVFWVVPNAFVVNIIFAWEQAVATTSEAEEGMIASHRFPMYQGKSGKCDVRFLKYAFLIPRGKHLLGLASPGGAGRNRTLGQAEFAKIAMVVPETSGEQARIADLLVLNDAQIAAESEKLEALKTHKKGLMQQLFPSAEA